MPQKVSRSWCSDIGYTMGQSGKFWKHVKFTEGGTPVYPEASEEQEVPYESDNPEALAKVQVSYSRTVNLGNYNSARVEVGVELPCHADEIQDAYDAAVEFVGPKYVETINQVIQSRKATNKGEAVLRATKKDYGY